MVVRLVGLIDEYRFASLASMPGLYRKKCKACQHDNHFNSNKCGGALDIQDQGGILPVSAMVGL